MQELRGLPAAFVSRPDMTKKLSSTVTKARLSPKDYRPFVKRQVDDSLPIHNCAPRLSMISDDHSYKVHRTIRCTSMLPSCCKLRLVQLHMAEHGESRVAHQIVPKSTEKRCCSMMVVAHARQQAYVIGCSPA
jgi:hypothetical protein